MKRQEPKHVKLQESEKRSEKKNKNTRGRVLMTLMFTICALLPAIQFVLISVSQLDNYDELALEKCKRYAIWAADIIAEEDLRNSESVQNLETRIDNLFSVSDCEQGDDVKWTICSLNGTDAAFLAGDESLMPSQREILSARNNGVYAAEQGQSVSASAIIHSGSRVLGLICVTVDYRAFGVSVHNGVMRALAALCLGLVSYCTAYILLGIIPKFKVSFEGHVEPAEKIGDIARRYIPRAVIIVLVIASVCLAGTWQIVDSGDSIYLKEQEEMQLQSDAFAQDTRSGNGSTNVSANVSTNVSTGTYPQYVNIVILTGIFSVIGGTVYVMCIASYDRARETGNEEEAAANKGKDRNVLWLSAVRLFAAASVGIVVMLIASIVIANSPDEKISSGVSAGRHPVVDIRSAVTNQADGNSPVTVLPESAEEGVCTVILNYSTGPDAGIKTDELMKATPEQITLITPQTVPGYAFYWMRGENVWNGADCYNGMTLKGVWIPIFDVTVY